VDDNMLDNMSMYKNRMMEDRLAKNRNIKAINIYEHVPKTSQLEFQRQLAWKEESKDTA
jgi:hypothetical protein